MSKRNYAGRLMAALQRAHDLDCLIEVDSDMPEFVITFRKTGAIYRLHFEDDDIISDDYIHELQLALDNMEFNDAMEAARLRTRAAALAKLTEDERIVLGV